MLDPTDTIAAVASPAGAGARGIVRLSGPEAWSIALAEFIAAVDAPLPDRAEVRAGSIRVDGLRPLLPASITLWPPPRTYTGQAIAEIHTVGSPPLIGLLLAHCLHRGARHAEPGEFTLRAFLSGRIDLTRAEAVLGVIEARNPAQLEASLQQLAGGLFGPIHAIRERLLDLVAHLEANLDFADEPDVDPLGREHLAESLEASAREMELLAESLRGRERPDANPRVVLVGAPNAGKSRLFNALIGDDRALVSPIAGTTRDYLTASVDCDGLTVELVDTAGHEAARDSIEDQAQAFRTDQAGRADLLLECIPADSPDSASVGTDLGLRVWTKCDLAPPPVEVDGGALATSASTGEGLDPLRREIAGRIRRQDAEGDLAATTGARCGDSLHQAGRGLRAASTTIRMEGGDELVALDLRLAIDELGKVVGAVVTDDILDRVFRKFCIGK